MARDGSSLHALARDIPLVWPKANEAHIIFRSGSTLIAADKTGRVCRGVELDPLYVDVIVRRYEAATGDPAVLVETGETFEALGARRSCEAVPARPDLERGSRP